MQFVLASSSASKRMYDAPVKSRFTQKSMPGSSANSCGLQKSGASAGDVRQGWKQADAAAQLRDDSTQHTGIEARASGMMLSSAEQVNAIMRVYIPVCTTAHW